MEMSRKIYLLRTENHLTQSEFAKIAGATDKAVSSWEKGTRSPKLQYTKPICEYFGIDLNSFVDESNDIYKPGSSTGRISNIAQRLKEYRELFGLTLSDVSKKCKIPMQTLSRYELEQRVPKIDTAVEIAESLRINPLWLQGYNVPMEEQLPSNAIPYTPSHKVPILGSIPAGYPVLAFEDIEGYADIPYSDEENYFFLRVNGESMKNAGIHTGDLVLIRRQKCADDGQVVAARVNGDEATLKRYKRQGDSVLLLPENPDFEPRIVPIKDFDTGDAEIIGVALEVRHCL